MNQIKFKLFFRLQAIALFALVAGAFADVSHLQTHPDVTAQVVRSDSVVNPDSFNYAYETSNGIVGQAAGQLKQFGQDSALVSQGEFGFTAPDNTKYVVNYVADENGYQPTGAHLPVAPAIPEAIVRALKYIAEHPQQQYQH